MSTLYLFGMYLFRFGIFLASFFNKKAKLWIKGRKDWKPQLSKAVEGNDKPVFWIHCASLGEFEQGRPIIEALKREKQSYFILLTFYSPSGYEIRKDYDKADFVSYLPLDTPGNAKSFLRIVKPKIAVFVKYEFWYFFLKFLKQYEIPVLLVSAIFRRDQAFFKPYGSFFRKMLSSFNYFFVQNESSSALLKSINFSNVTVAGDTRIDRVLAIAAASKAFDLVEAFCGTENILIAGSTWPADEAILLPFFHQANYENWKLIIAPHEIHSGHITQIERQLELPYTKYSAQDFKSIADKRILIIDNIGMLSSIYKYGKVAYIGGGFGKGIHNILEPGAFSLPIIFGPKYTKFEEATQLVDQGGAFVVHSRQELQETFEQISFSNRYEDISQKVQNYISQNKGATVKVLDYLNNQV